MCGSIHEAERGLSVAGGAGGEGERIFMGEPPGKLRLQFLAKVRPNIKVSDTRAPAEPLEHASAGEVSVERLDIDRNGSERLKRIEDDMSSNFVRLLDDGFGIVDVGAAKNDMRDRNNQSLLIDSIQQALGRNRDAIVCFDHMNLRAAWALRLPEIHDGRKVHVAVNDFVACAGEIKARCDHRLTGGNVLVK